MWRTVLEIENEQKYVNGFPGNEISGNLQQKE